MADPPALDDTDRAILHLLQEDARSTASHIADTVGVAPNTVRNRIDRLEELGIIEGWQPQVNYERAGFQLHIVFVCTVPISERRNLAENVMEIEGVIATTEILSGHQNLMIEVVGADTEDITRIATSLEDRGVTIRDERLIKSTRTQPFDHFGMNETSE